MAFNIWIFDSDWLIGRNIFNNKSTKRLRLSSFSHWRLYWICILISSLLAMTVVLVNTLNDSLNNSVVITIDPSLTRKSIVFPAVSVCSQQLDFDRTINRIEKYVRKYYEEHNIWKPPRYVDCWWNYSFSRKIITWYYRELYGQLLRYVYASLSGKHINLNACKTTNSTCGANIEAIK